MIALAALAAAAALQDPHAAHRAPAAPDPHAGHTMPVKPAAPDPHAGHSMPAKPAAPDPHAGHTVPVKPAAPDPHAGHAMPAKPAAPDPHAGHTMPATAAPAEAQPPPPAPTDHAADRIFPPAEMAAARRVLAAEHRGMAWSKVMLEKAEWRPHDGGDGYAWEGRASFGGDIDRFVVKSEGDGAGGDLEEAEIQALWAHAIGPYFNLQAGVRQDFQPRPRRTHAVLGVEGLAPYWFEVEALMFVSDKGKVSARLEGAYDLRLTQNWVLEPRAEANLAASDDAAIGQGSGLTELELGLRLRYAITPEIAPYAGVNWVRKFGDTADLARAAGDGAAETRFVVGLRAWF